MELGDKLDRFKSLVSQRVKPNEDLYQYRSVTCVDPYFPQAIEKNFNSAITVIAITNTQVPSCCR